MYLILQSTYKQLELGLFEDEILISSANIDKRDASKKLIPTLNNLLIENGLSLKNLDFIGVNQGPSPFTTLRVALATVNGIALSSDTKLIGVDALESYSNYIEQKYRIKDFCILFYAFAQEYYYLIQHGNSVQTGCNRIENVLPILENLPAFGNGIEYCKDMLKNSVIYEQEDYPTLQAIANIALEKYSTGRFETKIEPIYLKSI